MHKHKTTVPLLCTSSSYTMCTARCLRRVIFPPMITGQHLGKPDVDFYAIVRLHGRYTRCSARLETVSGLFPLKRKEIDWRMWRGKLTSCVPYSALGTLLSSLLFLQFFFPHRHSTFAEGTGDISTTPPLRE